jgi:hypothetical protein
MITDLRHRELLQRAIDAQIVVADELQSAYNARMALPVEHPQRLETRDLWRDLRALEILISDAYDLLLLPSLKGLAGRGIQQHGAMGAEQGAVTLQPKPQP